MIVDLADQMSITSAVMYCDYDRMKKSVGVTSGCFDALHYYHLVYLMRCAQQCEILVVGVDSDRKIRAEKGELRPIVNERHRLTMVNALKCVDACFILDDLDQFGEMCTTFIGPRTPEKSFVFRNHQHANRWLQA